MRFFVLLEYFLKLFAPTPYFTMNYKVLLFLAVISLSSFTSVHKFYVSVTEIEYNEKAQSLQIISRVFIDDFENVLKARYDKDIKLGARVETSGAEKHIEKYLEQKIDVALDGKPVEVEYLGKEYQNDMILFYIEVPQVKKFKEITVRNSVLMDLFEEQKNLVHVELNGRTKSMVLVSDNDKNSINF